MVGCGRDRHVTALFSRNDRSGNEAPPCHYRRSIGCFPDFRLDASAPFGKGEYLSPCERNRKGQPRRNRGQRLDCLAGENRRAILKRDPRDCISAHWRQGNLLRPSRSCMDSETGRGHSLWKRHRFLRTSPSAGVGRCPGRFRPSGVSLS